MFIFDAQLTLKLCTEKKKSASISFTKCVLSFNAIMHIINTYNI